MAPSEPAKNDPWSKYETGLATTPSAAPLRVTLPAELGLIIRQHSEHYNLSPEQILCAAIAVGLFDHRAWIASMQTLRLAAHLPISAPHEGQNQ